MKKSLIVMAAIFVAMVFVLAAGNHCWSASKQELKAKIDTIKVGQDGFTEDQVKALLGPPDNIEIREKIKGLGRTQVNRVLIYGDFQIVIDGEYKYVRAIKDTSAP